ncbi:outer membrane beta-barrel protein [uncultured Kordia sp.]|uniref:outer membrane beta-barrel protein n=1 Tax=uncultured Kordia sp. TaxID=507699 RepID=UPI0026076A7A|nr:outer membrane beta-barrel protein [uncultured Kordia sp.]
MKKNVYILTLLGLFTFYSTYAQSDTKRSIKASVGYGISTPYDDVEVNGSGFFAQGEYIMEFYNWLDIRPYAGFILASSDEEDNAANEAGFKSDANAFLIGGKARITAPIPWVAPYLEAGIGMSFGKFETITNTTNIEKSGALYHIPISVGLEIGRKHNIDVSLTYFVHPTAEQVSGAFTFGVAFPLN